MRVAVLALHACGQLLQLASGQPAKVALDGHGRVSTNGSEPITENCAVGSHDLRSLRGTL